MAQVQQPAFEPRKTPIQARSTVTVEAIAEATVQVLLSHGSERLTTTKVAERAGVSVGTLYQYFPNKRSLLFAVLADHLDKVSTAVESACARSRHLSLAAMVQAVVEAFVDAKMLRPDVSTALYRIAGYIGGPALVQRTAERSRKALVVVPQAAPDVVVLQQDFAIQMMFAAMAGATRSVLEAGAAPAIARKLRDHLVVLCQSYMMAIARPPPLGKLD